MEKLTLDELMQALEDAAPYEFADEYFGPEPKYKWKEVKEEIRRRIK